MMPNEPQGVTQDTSPTSPDAPDHADTPVTGDGAPADRPIQNIKAEFDRKTAKLEQQLAEQQTVMAQMMSLLTSQPKPAAHKEPTDEELLQLGTVEAVNLYWQRQLERQKAQILSTLDQRNTVQARLGGLYTKYPVLRNPQHPLTQAAVLVKHALLAQGRPNDHTTDLEAITVAIADHPELVAELVKRPTEADDAARRSSVRQQDVIDGGTRRPRKPAEEPIAVSEREAAIAARMGVDPVKAKKRFQERQASGRSAIGPTALTAITLTRED